MAIERSGEQVRCLQAMLDNISRFNEATDAEMGSPSKNAEYSLRQAWAEAYQAHTNRLAVAAMKEARTRLFAEMTDEQFAEVIGRLGGTLD